MAVKKDFELSASEIATLRRLASQGTSKARVIRRAHTLLLLSSGLTREEVAKTLHCGVATVGRTKRRYLLGGLDEALYEFSRSGRPVAYGDRVKKKLVALACTTPPCGRGRWTTRLIMEHCDEKDAPSRNTVNLILRAEGIKPWREKNVVRPDA